MARWQFRLQTLFVGTTLVAVVLSITPWWHRQKLWTDRPYPYSDPSYLPLEGEYEAYEESIEAARLRLHRQFTPTFAAFFLSASMGVWYAVKHSHSHGKVSYGLSYAWPLCSLYWPFFAVSLFGSLITLLCLCLWCIVSRRFIACACSFAANALWLAHAYWYEWQWFQVFGD